MTMRLLLAAMIAASLTFAPAGLAEDAMKPVSTKSKTHKAAKARKNTERVPLTSGRMKKNDSMMGGPYSTQKDEMTR